MKRLRDHFLSCAVLARDQDIRVGRSHARDQLKYRLHGRRLRNERGPACGAQ